MANKYPFNFYISCKDVKKMQCVISYIKRRFF